MTNGERRRVLYIDDDEGLRRLAKRNLERRGYEVVTAADGSEGVVMAAAEPYDVITLDHYMPGMDGLATLAALKELRSTPPVVYVTGSEESSIAVAALKAGASDYVVKSVGEDFYDLLERAFGSAFAQQELRRGKEEAEAALRASNERLETLLREVNHRVSNSLQLVSAFVAMQSRSLPDEAAREALMDTERRIQAIAQVHRRLYTGSDVESVDMQDYLAALVGELQETWSTPDAPRLLTLTAEPMRLKTDKAVSLGVIVNELVSNACKYAYEGAERGEVRIAFGRDGEEHFLLRIEDDGCGLPADGKPRGTGLGSRVITAMAASLSSRVEYDAAHRGVRASLRAAL